MREQDSAKGQTQPSDGNAEITVKWRESVSYRKTYTFAELRAVLDEEGVPRSEWLTAEGYVSPEQLVDCDELTEELAKEDTEDAFFAVDERTVEEVTLSK